MASAPPATAAESTKSATDVTPRTGAALPPRNASAASTAAPPAGSAKSNGAVATNEPDDLAGCDAQVNAVDGDEATEPLDQPGREQRRRIGSHFLSHLILATMSAVRHRDPG